MIQRFLLQSIDSHQSIVLQINKQNAIWEMIAF